MRGIRPEFGDGRAHLCVALLIACLPLPVRAEVIRGHGDRIGVRAGEWGRHVWLNSRPLTLSQLKGKVVLVRWWTDGCSLCASTAPALNELHDRYAGSGLVVVGMYHPKPPRDVAPRDVARAAERLGFKFPIALDNDWGTLRQWWLSTGRREYTSVTFLIDREGVIRAIHPGGEFHTGGGPDHAACARDYAALRHEIEQLLGRDLPAICATQPGFGHSLASGNVTVRAARGAPAGRERR